MHEEPHTAVIVRCDVRGVKLSEKGQQLHVEAISEAPSPEVRAGTSIPTVFDVNPIPIPSAESDKAEIFCTGPLRTRSATPSYHHQYHHHQHVRGVNLLDDDVTHQILSYSLRALMICPHQ